jgi:Zn-finger nucleic acid-binding protein
VRWAKVDLRVLSRARPRVAMEPEEQLGKPEPPEFCARHEGAWRGPHAPAELLAMGIVGPATFVCQAGSSEILRAAESPHFLPLFDEQVTGSVAGRRCPRCRTALSDGRYEGAPLLQCRFCHGHLLEPGVLERILARQEKEFSKVEIESVKGWRGTRRGPVRDLCEYPSIRCPLCRAPMDKYVHSSLTKVVLDRCSDRACRTTWCDGGELEKIQILVETACAARERRELVSSGGDGGDGSCRSPLR